MKKRNLNKLIKEAVIFILILFVFSNIVSYVRAPSFENKKLPSFSAVTIEGKKFDSTDTKNAKPIMIHFWATWCPTCKMENSTIASLSKKFNVITVVENSGDDEKIKEFLKEKNLKLNVINDKDSHLASLFKISGYPTTFIYDKEGVLKFSEVGYSSYLTLYLKLLYAHR
ncbi:TlpA disulfide reductase family protein [Sulfurimonas sp. HSL-1716]|uniref:TlpA family protein disulfide reductase n=1 Tax=Hydrocurvibacter sulfurireducens TaxID=3131937 RepID=UPI0031F75651